MPLICKTELPMLMWMVVLYFLICICNIVLSCILFFTVFFLHSFWGCFHLLINRQTHLVAQTCVSLCISHTDWFLSMKPETSKSVSDVYPLRSLNKGVCECMSGLVIFLPLNVDFYSMFVMSLGHRVQ